MSSVEKVSLGKCHGFLTRGGEELPPVLAVHGAFGHPEQLTTLMTALAGRGIMIYALALRGHDRGTSSAVEGLGVLDYVRDVHQMIQHMRARPVLLGHSMGGSICEKVAEKSRVRGR
ncbi:MAG: alpha/beta hydrolase [Gemmatimonadaceae bacterium]